MKPSLQVELCGVELPNPVILASGVLGATGAGIARALRSRAGAATFKSVGLTPRKGHPGPVIVPFEAGWLNAVGLSNPGMDAFVEEYKAARHGADGALSISVFSHNAYEYTELVEKADDLAPEFIELNLSCPNVSDEFGRPFALDVEATKAAVSAGRKATKRPLLAKITATAPNIVQIGKAAIEAGADVLVTTNTLGPGMVIDVRRRCPVLANTVGGVSGSAIRPIALRSVWQLAQLGCPIVAVGGVSNGEHVAQMMMAGATAVQVGTCLVDEGFMGITRIVEEFSTFLQEEKYEAATELIGLARRSKQ